MVYIFQHRLLNLWNALPNAVVGHQTLTYLTHVLNKWVYTIQMASFVCLQQTSNYLVKHIYITH